MLAEGGPISAGKEFGRWQLPLHSLDLCPKQSESDKINYNAAISAKRGQSANAEFAEPDSCGMAGSKRNNNAAISTGEKAAKGSWH
jgi:hypothetical protein